MWGGEEGVPGEPAGPKGWSPVLSGIIFPTVSSSRVTHKDEKIFEAKDVQIWRFFQE